MIYLDNAATTKMFEKCGEVYMNFASSDFFNPSAGYIYGVNISRELENARKCLLKKLGAKSGDIIFTGGATESNNLAIRGSKRKGWEHIFSIGEHPSVYNVAKELELENNEIIKFVPLQNSGQIDYSALERVLSEKTRLISVMHVSNETGAVNDIERISAIRDKICPKALLHVDGVQAFCKIPVNLENLGVDLYTISAHKFHGPKGVGALYVKNKASLKNIVFGGGQEFGIRSGTENVGGIMAMKYAFENIDVEKNFEHVKKLNSIFKQLISEEKRVNFIETQSPYIISLSFEGVNGETLMRALENDVVVGTGSACSTKKAGNRVLEAMGKSQKEIKSSIRVSFNAYMSENEVEKAAKIILDKYKQVWEKVK